MSTTTITRTTSTTKKPTLKNLRRDVDEATLAVSFQEALIKSYVKTPALDKDGGPMPLPLRRRIALSTAKSRLSKAEAALAERTAK